MAIWWSWCDLFSNWNAIAEQTWSVEVALWWQGNCQKFESHKQVVLDCCVKLLCGSWSLCETWCWNPNVDRELEIVWDRDGGFWQLASISRNINPHLFSMFFSRLANSLLVLDFSSSLLPCLAPLFRQRRTAQWAMAQQWMHHNSIYFLLKCILVHYLAQI